MFVILGIINSASFLSHGREFQIANLAFGAYLIFWIIKDKVYLKIQNSSLLKLFREENSLKTAKNYVYSVVITTLFIFPWWSALNLFSERNLGEKLIAWGYKPLFHQVTFSDFGIFLYLITIGVIISIVYLVKMNRKELDLSIIFSLMFFISGVVIIAGSNSPQARSFYTISFFPILFIFFINILNITSKISKIEKSVLTCVIFTLLLILVYMNHKPQEIGNTSLIQPLRMDSFNWIKNNLEETNTILTIYGDEYNQKSIFVLIRRPYQIVNQGDYFNKIKEGKITSTYKIDKWVVHEKFIRDPETGKVRPDPNEYTPVEDSLCNYKYIYSDKYSSNTLVAQYTVALLNTLIKETNFEIIYDNQLITILRNKNIGGACFSDKTITY